MPSPAEPSSLLEDDRNEPSSSQDFDPPRVSTSDNKDSTWSANFRDIVHLAGPAILQLSFQQAVIVTNQSMAGHLGPEALAAAAIAVTWFNLMWFFIIGAASALDTLASQAFGAGDRPGVIQWAISATVILTIMAVPMAVALFFADSVASAVFRQPPNISQMVGIYCRGILPGLWPFIWSLIIMKAMQAQNQMWGPTLVTIGMFVVNIFVNMGFIRLYGFTGAAYAQSASRILLFLFLLVYVLTFGRGCIRFDRPVWHAEEVAPDAGLHQPNMHIRSAFEEASQGLDDTQTRLLHVHPGCSPSSKGTRPLEAPPFSHPSFGQVLKAGLSVERLFMFLQLGTAGGLMMAADASSFDITTAMAGRIGVEEVGAHTSLLTIIEFIYTSFPYGIATAATIRVGNMLGAGNATSARQSAYLCLAGCACFNLTVMLLFFAFGDQVGLIFTRDARVVRLVAKLSILAGLYQIPDCIYGSVSGILRGTGRQASLMWSNLAGFWGVGMPLCYILAFRYGYGVQGLWLGLVSGLSCSALLVLGMLLLLDWDAEAENAQRVALLMEKLEGDDEEASGGDTFSTDGAAEATAAARSPRMRRSNSLPIVQHRTKSLPQMSVGSLTGSYCRPINSHL